MPRPPSHQRPSRGRAALAAAVLCGLTFAATGCASARRTVARPVMGAVRAIPGVNRLAPAPAPPPARVLNVPAPRPAPRPVSQPTPQPVPRADPRPTPYAEGWTPSPPRPAAPIERSVGPHRLVPRTIEPNPAARPTPVQAPRPAAPRSPAPLDESTAPPPAPAPPEDAEAYFPVRGDRGPLASAWEAFTNFGLRPDRPEPAATRLVAYERDTPAARARPAAPSPAAPSFAAPGPAALPAAPAAPLIELGRPVLTAPAAPVWTPAGPSR